MTQVVCTVDGSTKAEAAALSAIAEARPGDGPLTLVGVVREPRFDVPQPAVGQRILRLQRVETQLVRLASAAKSEGLDVLVALPGHESAGVTSIALRPAAA
jgi:hypothetical protein